MSAREIILGGIRSALGGPRTNAAELERYVGAHARGPAPRTGQHLVKRFRDRAEKLASDVTACAKLADAPPAVAQYLAAHDLPLRAVCWPDLAALPWRQAGIDVVTRAATGDDLVGVTGVVCAIAETGTLMVASGERTPASVSLLPETHVAVVETPRIVATLEDAWEWLRRERGALPRALNLISGPSRTADIEQTVTLGAHGPYRVLVVLVGDDAG
jgi:L-lactate dehydrogenase complex protein LldG